VPTALDLPDVSAADVTPTRPATTLKRADKKTPAPTPAPASADPDISDWL
jgi:hypothetical protein